MFQEFYGSFFQHPVMLWAIPLLYVGLRFRALSGLERPSFLAPYLKLVTVGTLLDATLTTESIIEWASISPGLAQAIAIVFVILGDFRVLYLVLRLHGSPYQTGIAALAMSLVVPLLQGLLTQIFPEWFANVRHTFLVYELLFIALLVALLLRQRKLENEPGVQLARDVLVYALTYYCLWATADIIIVAGFDVGYLIRVIPNVLYYGVFVVFVDYRASVRPLGTRSLKATLVVSSIALLGLPLGCSRADGSPAPCGETRPVSTEAPRVAPESARIRLGDPKSEGREVTLAEVEKALGAGKKVETFDPYYSAHKSFWGWPASELLAWAFPGQGEGGEVELRAVDGYEVRLSLSQLARDRAFFVYADAELPSWAPIGPRAADPGPLYLVWPGEKHTDLTTHPRPYSVVALRKASEEEVRFGPPEGFAEGTPERRGEELFESRCIRCHAMNQVGGKVGPDLNVPRNILEYRAEADVVAYIRDPGAFRYGTMPSHPDLSEEDLSALTQFLRAMQKFKHDPGSKGAH